ncbi:MAG: SRPBCC family protein [Bdellovibrionales bacterium]|nr:SRPBCC family protein [Bdellovibrionales bacterium]
MALGLILALLLILPAFLGERLQIERSTFVSASPEKIFAYIEDLNNFKTWNPFLEAEPQAQVMVLGSGVGSTYSWEGEKVGKGIMTVSSIEQDKKIEIAMAFIAPVEGKADVIWEITPESNGANVTWAMTQDYSYFRRYFKLVMPSMMNAAFDSGLLKLKKQLEEEGPQ